MAATAMTGKAATLLGERTHDVAQVAAQGMGRRLFGVSVDADLVLVDEAAC